MRKRTCNDPSDSPRWETSSSRAASDVRLANLESTITDGTRYTSAYSGRTWLTTEPGCLADVARLGFNVLGFANNHTMDYSYDGLEETISCARRALRPSAQGRTSLRPRAPQSWRRRAAARRSLPSALRLRTPPAWTARSRACPAGSRPPARADCLPRGAVARTGVNVLRQALRSQGFLPPLPEGTMDFGPILLEEVESEAQESCFSCATCQDVVILVHSHEIKAVGKEEPDYFLEDFARQCIDAGASAVVGSGTH